MSIFNDIFELIISSARGHNSPLQKGLVGSQCSYYLL